MLACFGLGMIGLVILWFACDLLCVNLFVCVILRCVCESVVLGILLRVWFVNSVEHIRSGMFWWFI